MHDRARKLELAEAVLRTIRANEATELRRLLAEGASPDGFWDEELAIEQAARANAQLAPTLDDASWLEDAPPEVREQLEASMRETAASFVEPNKRPIPSGIPLHLAVMNGFDECVKALIEAGVDLNQVDFMGQTALFDARTTEMQRLLIEAGTDPLITNDSVGRDAFQEALRGLNEFGEFTEDDVALCRNLLTLGVPLVRPLSVWGESRLHDAAFAENLSAVRLLLQLGHPIEIGNGPTVLHSICWHWDYQDDRDRISRGIVCELLQAGIDPNARDERGHSPLHEALSGDGTNLVAAEELLKAGGDINAVNNDGLTPLHLHYETLFDYGRVVPFMLEHGANPMIKDKYGRTVLDIARAMATGAQPRWRVEAFAKKGKIPCGWKSPAKPGDHEMRAIALLEQYGRRKK